MATSDTFRVGLCMAGAISAGAYTAGVVDYLIEALDEWQKRKNSEEPNVPTHKVEIPIIGGASAGGMTGIITASILEENFSPVKELDGDILQSIPSNKLYHSWVDLVADDMLKILLDTDDIKDKTIYSALNSTFIEKIADRLIDDVSTEISLREYIPKDFRVFVTLSNLKGMDFDVIFKSHSPKDSSYVVTNHSDFATFRFAETENDYKNDGWIPLNFKTRLNAQLVKDAAMATGAFPIGLRARKVIREGKYLNDLSWFDYITKDAGKPFPSGLYESVIIDGGMINNEPFENIRQILTELTNQENPDDYQNYEKFMSTILMIDPFPSQTEDIEDDTKNNIEIKPVIGNTLGALIDQSRIKSRTLIDTKGTNKAGQYLIQPVRYTKENDSVVPIEGSKAIACGSLDGFGGFFSKEFRVHDYFLGRANCEWFLREYFTVPKDTNNPIFKKGYSNVSNLAKFTSKSGGLQIIPIFTEAKSEPYIPTFANGEKWPTVTTEFLDSYRKLLKRRIEKLLLNFTDYTTTQRALLWIGAKVVLNGRLADAVLETVKDSFEKSKLMQE